MYVVKLGESCQGHKIRMVWTVSKFNLEALLEDLQSAKWEINSVSIGNRWDQWKNVYFLVYSR